MSVASEINRIKSNIADAYTEAEAKGATMPATENSANLAQTVASIQSTPTLQSKAVTPTTSQQSVTPDSGYDGLSDVTVNATPLEAKSVTPTTQQQTIVPTAPNIGFNQVTVEAIQSNGLDEYLEGTANVLKTNATSIRDSALTSLRWLYDIYMPNVTSIGINAFYGCPALNISIIPSGLLTIANRAFMGCIALASADLPDSITSIGREAFRGCASLAITKLPKNVLDIGNNAFDTCTAIPYLDMSELVNIPTLGTNVFANTTFPFLFADQTQLDAYASATNWSALASQFQIKGVTP